MGRPAMSASCFGEPKRDELPAASSITCRLDAAVLRSSACPCPLPCRCAWISAVIASAMLAGSRPPSSRPTGACRRAPNFAAVAAPRSGQQPFSARRRTEQSHVGNRSRGQCLECREVGREVMAHDHGGIEPRQIHVMRQLRRSGQQHPPCPRQSRRVGVSRPMVRHGHAPAQRGAELHHRQCVGTAADQQQFARDGRGGKEQAQSGTVELDDPGGRRTRRVPVLSCQPGGQAVQAVRRAGPDRPQTRASCRRASPAAAESSTKAYLARSRCSKHRDRVAKGSQFVAGSSRTSQTSMPPSQPAPNPHSRSSSPRLSYRTSFGVPVFEHRLRVCGQVALETAARKYALVPATGADQHLCPGLAVGRAAGGDDRREHERRPVRARPLVHRQQLMQ